MQVLQVPISKHTAQLISNCPKLHAGVARRCRAEHNNNNNSMLPTVPGMLVLVEYSNDEIRPMVATALQHFLHSTG